ncbi:putative Parafibromin [Monoraphidium neglectum]|uniref:Putative Parafibromin n=1 Tax=Monoraphidium neglectum TaxID=145388 RepID=A0A0D2J2N3_9CHLO|nr:putative Parafibromin [Monoraphidium neglectum]KIY94217.1 putative Parafibromin [Monoraphidium neglectum]|eukprot:XP_013893237.1 putative Parafibromin [Monoraphidium neglectum]
MEANPAKPASLTIKRTMLRDKPTPYVITDKAPAKGSSDWRRVVAVIVQGKAWQFKDFPFKGADTGNLVDTFHNVLGIYPHYADERPPDTVRSWNVRLVPLQREGRFLDRAAVLDVFKALDAFLAARRCELEY